MLFTCNRQIDIIIMSYIDDDDLLNVTLSNKYALSLYNNNDLWVQKLMLDGFPIQNKWIQEAKKIYNMGIGECMEYAIKNDYYPIIDYMMKTFGSNISWGRCFYIFENKKYEMMEYMLDRGFTASHWQRHIHQFGLRFVKMFEERKLYSEDRIIHDDTDPEIVNYLLEQGYTIKYINTMLHHSSQNPELLKVLLKHVDIDAFDIFSFVITSRHDTAVICFEILIDHGKYLDPASVKRMRPLMSDKMKIAVDEWLKTING